MTDVKREINVIDYENLNDVARTNRYLLLEQCFYITCFYSTGNILIAVTSDNFRYNVLHQSTYMKLYVTKSISFIQKFKQSTIFSSL